MYVKRNDAGKIDGWRRNPSSIHPEQVPDDDAELHAFMNRPMPVPPDPMLRLVDATIAALDGDRTALAALKTELEG